MRLYKNRSTYLFLFLGLLSTLVTAQVEVYETYIGSQLIGKSIDGNGESASFNKIGHLYKDYSTNTVYVFDNGVIRTITNDTVVNTLPSNDEVDNNYAVNSKGEVHYVDDNYLYKLEADGSRTIVTGQGESGFVDGSSSTAYIGNGAYPVFDSNDNFYFYDYNYTIRRVSPNGNVKTIAGQPGVHGYKDDNKGSNAQFSTNYGMTIDDNDNLYVLANSDVVDSKWNNKRVDVVRKISTRYPYTVSTFVGEDIVNNASGLYTEMVDNGSVIDDGTAATYPPPFRGIDHISYDVSQDRLVLLGGSYAEVNLSYPYNVEIIERNTHSGSGDFNLYDGPTDWDRSGLVHRAFTSVYWNSLGEPCFAQSKFIKRITTSSKPKFYFFPSKTDSISISKCLNSDYAQRHTDYTSPGRLELNGINLNENVSISISNGFHFQTSNGWTTGIESISPSQFEQGLTIKYEPISHDLGLKNATLTITSSEIHREFYVDWSVINNPAYPIIDGGTERCDAGEITLIASVHDSLDEITWMNAETDRQIDYDIDFDYAKDTLITTIDSTSRIYITSEVNGCYSIGGDTVLVTIHKTPELDTITSTTVCDNGTVNLEALYDLGTISWWNQSTGGTKYADGNTLNENINIGTYFYAEATDNGCTSVRDSIQSIITPTFEIDNVLHNSVCLAGPISLSASSAGGIINWYNDTTTSSLATGDVYTPSITKSDTFWVQVDNSSCLSELTPVYASITTVLKTDSLNGPLDVCEGQEVTYSTNTVNGADSYTWAVPNGSIITDGQNTQSITVLVGEDEGFVTVTPNGSCGDGVSREKYIRVYKTPINNAMISGPDTVCAQQLNVNYTIDEIDNATAYQWTTPDTSFITSKNDSTEITLSFNYNSNQIANIELTPLSQCGAGTTVSKSIIINKLSIDNSSLGTALVQESYGVQLQANGFHEVSWTSSSTPSSISLSNDSLTGIPVENEVGSYQVVITATEVEEPSCVAQKTVTLPVQFKASAWNGSSWTNGEPNEFTDVTLNANYNTSISGLFASHNLTILTGDTLTIEAPHQVNVVNDLTTFGSGAVTVTCLSSMAVGGLQNGVITLLPPSIITETGLLPGAFKDSSYNYTLLVENIPSPNWTLLDNTSLPEGLTLVNNVITGRPTGEGEYSFTVQAEDRGCVAEQEFTIRIGDLLPSFLTVSNESKIYGDSNFTVSSTSLNSASVIYSLIPADGCARIDSLTGEVEILCGANSSITIVASQASDGVYYGLTSQGNLIIRKAVADLLVQQPVFNLEYDTISALSYSTNSDASPYFIQTRGANVALISATGDIDLLSPGSFSVEVVFPETDKYKEKRQALDFTVITTFQALQNLKATELVTPNGDGLNEVFEIRERDSSLGNNLKIFDRSGNIVLDQDDYQNDWNGLEEGEITFFFIYKEENDSTIRELKGQFSIQR